MPFPATCALASIVSPLFWPCTGHQGFADLLLLLSISGDLRSPVRGMELNASLLCALLPCHSLGCQGPSLFIWSHMGALWLMWHLWWPLVVGPLLPAMWSLAGPFQPVGWVVVLRCTCLRLLWPSGHCYLELWAIGDWSCLVHQVQSWLPYSV